MSPFYVVPCFRYVHCYFDFSLLPFLFYSILWLLYSLFFCSDSNSHLVLCIWQKSVRSKKYFLVKDLFTSRRGCNDLFSVSTLIICCFYSFILFQQLTKPLILCFLINVQRKQCLPRKRFISPGLFHKMPNNLALGILCTENLLCLVFVLCVFWFFFFYLLVYSLFFHTHSLFFTLLFGWQVEDEMCVQLYSLQNSKIHRSIVFDMWPNFYFILVFF